jgi:hypothetical protein
MSLDASLVPNDRLDMIVESDDPRFDADFLAKFAQRRFAQRFADLDAAAGQRIQAAQRRPRPARDKRPPVAKNGGRDGEDRARGIKAIVQGGTSNRLPDDS